MSGCPEWYVGHMDIDHVSGGMNSTVTASYDQYGQLSNCFEYKDFVLSLTTQAGRNVDCFLFRLGRYHYVRVLHSGIWLPSLNFVLFVFPKVLKSIFESVYRPRVSIHITHLNRVWSVPAWHPALWRALVTSNSPRHTDMQLPRS